MSKEAMKLALEALEGVWKGGFSFPSVDTLRQAITALREALAEPDFWEGYVPEPVKPAPTNCRHCGGADNVICAGQCKEQPAQQEPLQPVWDSGPTNKDYEDAMRQKRLHQLTSPPAQRTWVGLTDEEFQWIYDHGRTPAGMMELVEAKLKEKNT